MALRSLYNVSVIAVLFLVVLYYLDTLFLVIDPFLGLDTAPGILNAGVISLLCCMALVTYILSITTEAGSIPSQYIPETGNSSGALQEVKRKGGEPRYCQKCGNFKPPRSHHCRICKRCVLKMDHHCNWINNCVGFKNYKSFFLFVMYTEMALIHSSALMIWELFQGNVTKEGEVRSDLFLSTQTLNFLSLYLKLPCAVLAGPLMMTVGGLLFWHIYLSLVNKTTIEHYEGVRARWVAKKTGEKYRHPYDLGVVRNLRSVGETL